MAQADTYTRTTDFASDERTNAGGRTTVRADRLSAELDAIGLRLNQTRDNLEQIQRDDGRLRDGAVLLNAISTQVAAMFGGSDFNPRGLWVSTTNYARLDLVEVSGADYVALVTHLSGATFDADRAAGRWQIFPGTGSAGASEFTPTDDIEATNVQDAIEEVSADARALAQPLTAYYYGAF